MRIILIGTVVFSREMLMQLIRIGVEIHGVCMAEAGAPNADFADLGPTCLEHGIPLHRTRDINSAGTIAWIRERRPDVIFCFGWSRLIGKTLLSLPPQGVVGYHPAALPANRGRHPLIWALALGLEKISSTFFLMDEGADSGDILSQAEVAINEDDDASSVYRKMTDTAKRQLQELVPALAHGRIERRKQDASQASTWRKRSAADGRIDWRMSARGIHNLVRALARPYPGADFTTPNGIVRVWKTSVVEDVPANAEPGKVLFHLDGKPVVRCGEQAVCLLETDPPFDAQPGDYL